jgi:hypothetical protein
VSATSPHDPLDLALRRAELAEQGERAQARRAAAAERRVRELEGDLLTAAAVSADAQARHRTTERDLRAELAKERRRAAAATAEVIDARSTADAAVADAVRARETARAAREAAATATAAAEAKMEEVRRAAAEREHGDQLNPPQQRIAALERELAHARTELAEERDLRLAVTAELSRRLAFERAEFARRRVSASAA